MSFTMQNTDGNTDGLHTLVYSRGEGTCSPPPCTVHYTQHLWKHRQFMFVGVFQRRGDLFPSPIHCSLCTTPMETLTICIRWCIPEARGTAPLPNTIHYAKHRWFVFVVVFERWGELFPFSCRWQQLLGIRFPRELPMDSVLFILFI